MAKATSSGPSNQHLELEPDYEHVSVNEEGNPVSVLHQTPIDAGEPEEGTESTETGEQDGTEDQVQDEVPEPPQVPSEPVDEVPETADEKAVRLQAELDALKGGN